MVNFLRDSFNAQTLYSCFSVKYLRFNLVLPIILFINAVLLIFLRDYPLMQIVNSVLFIFIIVNATYMICKLIAYRRKQKRKF